LRDGNYLQFAQKNVSRAKFGRAKVNERYGLISPTEFAVVD
jgi:hypothetical protein